MFQSYFPNHKFFFLSVLLWFGITVLTWHSIGNDIGGLFGFNTLHVQEAKNLFGLAFFTSSQSLWFYLYYIVASLIFYAFWAAVAPTKWQNWSILGSCGIILLTYCYVQYAVAFNNWFGPYMDLVQEALTTDKKVPISEFYNLLYSGCEIFAFGSLVFALNRFLISHYIFRWRTAMSDYYISHWSDVRHIEGASQRVQEDTMKFAKIMEGVGVIIADALMTLIAFIPVLITLSSHITELPLVGAIPYPLCISAIAWALLATVFLGSLGYKLPGLEYENQKVEAAYRKELVLGEDDVNNAQTRVLRGLFDDIQKNYFKMYLHYSYFNLGRQSLLYMNWIFMLILLAPSVVAGAMTFGIFSQIRLSFSEVSTSMQCLVKAWPEVIEAISVRKRLLHFEEVIKKRQGVVELPIGSKPTFALDLTTPTGSTI